MSAGVQQLCRDLGPITELNDAPAGEGSESGESNEGQPPPPPSGNLLSDIRRLLVENKARDDDSNALQASVNGLIAAVQEDLRRNAEARNMLSTFS